MGHVANYRKVLQSLGKPGFSLALALGPAARYPGLRPLAASGSLQNLTVALVTAGLFEPVDPYRILPTDPWADLWRQLVQDRPSAPEGQGTGSR